MIQKLHWRKLNQQERLNTRLLPQGRQTGTGLHWDKGLERFEELGWEWGDLGLFSVLAD